jgi:hypothetical protein
VPPAAALRDIVECYWLARTPETEAQRFRFLPTGRCDIVFNRDGSMLDHRGLIRMVEPGVYVVGPCEQYTRLEPHPKSLLFGIRLRPAVASGLLDLDVADLTGRSERIDCFSAGVRSLELLGDRHAAADLGRLITRVERILKKVASRPLRQDVTVARAIDEIERARGNCSISGLARQVSLGGRQLSRRFAIQTGLTPKRFAQLIRFGQVARCPPRRSRGARAQGGLLRPGTHDARLPTIRGRFAQCASQTGASRILSI